MKKFIKKINQRVNQLVSENEGKSTREVFLSLAYESFSESLDTSDLVTTNYDSEYHKMRLDGYDLVNNEQITLYVADYNLEATEITEDEVKKYKDYVKNFIVQSKGNLYEYLSEGDTISDISQFIHSSYRKIKQFNINVVSNRVYSGPKSSEDKLDEKLIYLEVFDANTLKEHNLFGEVEESSIKIEFEKGLSYVKCDESFDKFDVYLMFINGRKLAELYAEYGYSLLEGNVRTYLKKTNKQNQGILETIQYSPDCFVSYNNGLSTVADSIKIRDGKITQIEGWKIVNGGQTTATLYTALQEGMGTLNSTIVPVKMTVLKEIPNKLDLIARISEFANTQNKVSKSDLTSNQSYHTKMEILSRQICVPTAIKGTELTKWFYERLRGQYELAKERAISADAFRVEFPKEKKFDKTDLAKSIMAWEQEPFSVGLGKENNFGVFNNRIRANEGQFEVNEEYYQKAIATIILFNEVDKIVRDRKFGGFGANVTAYTVSLLSYLSNQKLDLLSIWEDQYIDDALVKIIKLLIEDVYNVITDTPVHHKNVQMYCRQEECWEKVRDYHYDVIIPDSLCIDISNQLLAKNTHVVSKGKKIELEDVTADMWGKIAAWGRDTELIAPQDRKMAYSMMRYTRTGKELSQRQIDYAKSIIRNAYSNGFDPEKMN